MKDIKIAILGDICPTDDFRSFFDRHDITLISDLYPLLASSDLCVANLECPATSSNIKSVKCGPNQRAKPEDLSFIKEMGIDVLSLANNHIKDYGEQAVSETVLLSRDAGLKTFGAGNKQEAQRGLVIEANGKKIGLLGFAEEEFNLAKDTEAGANFFDVFESPGQIAKLKEQCDFLIVLYHGGIEHYRYASPMLQKKCRLMVRSGADFVICQHSHCIGTFEEYSGGRILYGQGNGIFGYRKDSPLWNEGMLIQITIGETVCVDFTILKATPEAIRLAGEEEALSRLKQFKEQSRRLSDDKWLKDSWRQFCMKQADLDRPLMYGMGRISIKLNRITKNLIFKLFISKKREMVTMNFVRCDSLREVITTIMETDLYGK